MLYYILLLLNVFTQHCVSRQFKLNLLDNEVSYEICNEEKNSFKLNYIKFSPVMKGGVTTIELDGFLNTDIKDGSNAVVNVKYKKINLIKKKIDICKELDNNDIEIKCPIEKGEKKMKYDVKIPNEIPSGEYKIDLLLKNDDETDIFCSSIFLSID